MRKNARKGSRLEEDGGDYRYSAGSFNAHTRREEGGGGKERGIETGICLMSFAQIVRREANVIYENRATSRVDEVSRLENL